MLTRLEVDGFKSLRDFALDLEPFTVLVGPNGAGKSNIVEALALLSRLGTRVAPEAALQGGRGRAIDQFARHRGTSAQKITMAAEVLQLDQDGDDGELYRWAERFRYEVSLTRQSAGKSSERVKPLFKAERIPTASDPWRDQHPEWDPSFVTPAEEHHEQEYEWPPFFALHTLQIETSRIRGPSERIDPGSLASDAHNLPSVLASLSDATLAEIRAELVGLIPGLSDFRIIERDDTHEIQFLTRDGDEIPARLASDGTLRMLAVLTAVLGGPSWDTTICIEEPENGIFPGRLRRLIDLLREVTSAESMASWRAGECVSSPPQVLVTTHSPVFLAALRDHPRALRYVDLVRKDHRIVTRARALPGGGTEKPGSRVSLAEIEAVLGGTVSFEDER